MTFRFFVIQFQVWAQVTFQASQTAASNVLLVSKEVSQLSSFNPELPQLYNQSIVGSDVNVTIFNTSEVGLFDGWIFVTGKKTVNGRCFRCVFVVCVFCFGKTLMQQAWPGLAMETMGTVDSLPKNGIRGNRWMRCFINQKMGERWLLETDRSTWRRFEVFTDDPRNVIFDAPEPWIGNIENPEKCSV